MFLLEISKTRVAEAISSNTESGLRQPKCKAPCRSWRFLAVLLHVSFLPFPGRCLVPFSDTWAWNAGRATTERAELWCHHQCLRGCGASDKRAEERPLDQHPVFLPARTWQAGGVEMYPFRIPVNSSRDGTAHSTGFGS